jgi:hypothetical protein
MKAHGQLRRSQVVTTWGPGSLLDLPLYSVILGGLDSWPNVGDLEEVVEPRLTGKLQLMTGITAPRLYAPPAASSDPSVPTTGIGVWRFPEWFLVQEESSVDTRERSRRIVHRMKLDARGRYDGQAVVPTRFVRACPHGHVDDLDWYRYVHEPGDPCRRQLWLDERGTGGDLGDLTVRCECKATRGLHKAAEIENVPLGICSGARPWLGRNANEDCNLPSRLLTRSAANAYFPQVLSVLSLPDRGSDVGDVVDELWADLQIVANASELQFLKKKPQVMERLAPFTEKEVLAAIRERSAGVLAARPLKEVELDAVLAAPEGFGDDSPVDEDFHARRLPDAAWRRSSVTDGIEAVVQLHRLREVVALTGFTRFEAVTPDIQGDYETDVERADLALEPQWFPAVENRGEGIFVQLRPKVIEEWLSRPTVKARLDDLAVGHQRWQDKRNSKSKIQRPFPGGPYVLLHTLSHLLIQSVAMRCGYPASSIRERIYSDSGGKRYGLLLYTGSPDAAGTLGGLVQQARYMEAHLAHALRAAALCSNDPICSQHSPGESMEERWLHGAACHGCSLIAETSCEMRNDYLDRALVVPIIGRDDAAFFGPVG